MQQTHRIAGCIDSEHASWLGFPSVACPSQSRETTRFQAPFPSARQSPSRRSLNAGGSEDICRQRICSGSSWLVPLLPRGLH